MHDTSTHSWAHTCTCTRTLTYKCSAFLVSEHVGVTCLYEVCIGIQSEHCPEAYIDLDKSHNSKDYVSLLAASLANNAKSNHKPFLVQWKPPEKERVNHSHWEWHQGWGGAEFSLPVQPAGGVVAALSGCPPSALPQTSPCPLPSTPGALSSAYGLMPSSAVCIHNITVNVHIDICKHPCFQHFFQNG